jgi:hypothetical protein
MPQSDRMPPPTRLGFLLVPGFSDTFTSVSIPRQMCIVIPIASGVERAVVLCAWCVGDGRPVREAPLAMSESVNTCLYLKRRILRPWI